MPQTPPKNEGYQGLQNCKTLYGVQRFHFSSRERPHSRPAPQPIAQNLGFAQIEMGIEMIRERLEMAHLQTAVSRAGERIKRSDLHHHGGFRGRRTRSQASRVVIRPERGVRVGCEREGGGGELFLKTHKYTVFPRSVSPPSPSSTRKARRRRATTTVLAASQN